MDVSSLITDLKSHDPAARAAAAEHLAQLEKDAAQPAAVALTLATADADEAVRQAATSALESLGPPATAQLPDLMSLLSDSRLDVAYWTVTLLGRLGKQAAAATLPLTGALGLHPELAVRERAAWALGQVGPAAISALPTLESAASSGQARLARLANTAIEQISTGISQQ